MKKSSSTVRQITVCVSLAHAAERDFLSGIFRFLDEGHRWKINLIQSSPPFTADALARAESSGETDGIIISDAHARDLITELTTTRIPLAVVSGTGFRTNHPLIGRSNPTVVVHNDNAAIGRLGFRHFCDCGKFNSFGFVPTERGVIWSDEREEAFLRAARAAGFRARVFRRPMDELGAWLRALPKPAAVMVAYDELASEVLAACAAESIAVPNQVAVLGVDNDHFVCRYADPPLSSILPNHEGMGYHAARLLNRLIAARTKPLKHKHINLQPLKVVIRESTGHVAPAAAIVDRAKELIARDAINGLTINSLAKTLRISRRLLELRFHELEGTTIGKAIAEKRLEEASRQIRATKHTIVRIAEDCGFSDAKHLTHRFKEKFGVSPLQYRNGATPKGQG